MCIFCLVSNVLNVSISAADSDREERQEASSRQGPLPDLLPQNEHPSRASLPRREAVLELAGQLRTIGDEYNARVLNRAVS